MTAALVRFGARWYARAGRNDLLVLAYHAVRPRPSTSLEVASDALESHVRILSGSGYRLTTFSEAIRSRGAGKLAAFTFDDGDVSVFEEAYPILSAIGAPGTLFVSPAAVGHAGAVSWSQLETLVRSGWEIGSHGVTHRALPTLDDHELERELRESKKGLEARLGIHCVSLAYPYGESDERSEGSAQATEYRFACCVGERAAPTELSWPRVGIGPACETPLPFVLKTSPLVRRLRATPAAPAVDRIARVVFRRTFARAAARAN
jgi:peptidoglycan/xylan/chitin deacetylase (PgdA/CDA1 family)